MPPGPLGLCHYKLFICFVFVCFIVQVDLGRLYLVAKVATQGRNMVDQWVTGYRVACSMNGYSFNTIPTVRLLLQVCIDVF